jgi:hypothetical protein
MSTTTVTLPTFAGVGITFIAIAGMFVGLRCLTSLYTPRRKLAVDDCASIGPLSLLTILRCFLTQ